MWVWSVKNSDSNGALLDHPRERRRVDALVGGEVADRELHADALRCRAGGRRAPSAAIDRRRPAGRGRPRAGRCRGTRSAAVAKASGLGVLPARPRGSTASTARNQCSVRPAGRVTQVDPRRLGVRVPDLMRRCRAGTRSPRPRRARARRRRAGSWSVALEHAESARPGSGGGAWAAACRRARRSPRPRGRSGVDSTIVTDSLAVSFSVSPLGHQQRSTCLAIAARARLVAGRVDVRRRRPRASRGCG